MAKRTATPLSPRRRVARALAQLDQEIAAAEGRQRLTTLPIAAFDWSARGLDVTSDGQKVEMLSDFEALLDRLERPHRIVCESSFESFLPARRSALVEEAKRQGHELLAFNPRSTGWRRKRLGFPSGDKAGLDRLLKGVGGIVRGSDELDARIIYLLAIEGSSERVAGGRTIFLTPIRAEKDPYHDPLLATRGVLDRLIEQLSIERRLSPGLRLARMEAERARSEIDRSPAVRRLRVNRRHTASRFLGTKAALGIRAAERLIYACDPAGWQALARRGATAKALNRELYRLLPAAHRPALGNDREFSLPLLAALGAAAAEAASRREFEQLLGLWAGGYPSQLRSDVHHWGYMMRNGGIGSRFKRNSRVDWRTFRRSLRWVFAMLRKSQGPSAPLAPDPGVVTTVSGAGSLAAGAVDHLP